MTTPGTIAEIFVDLVRQSADREALLGEHDPTLSFSALTWRQLAALVIERIEKFSGRGIGPTDHVVHISENNTQWLITDLALQFLGAVHIPFHSLATEPQVFDLLCHCQPKAVIVSSRDQAAKTLRYLAQADVQSCLFGYRRDGSNIDFPHGLRIDWLKPGDAEPITMSPRLADRLQEQLKSNGVTADRILSILYTSGTTGTSKGVMLTQANVVANVQAKLSVLPLEPEDVRLCILPLSHIFARTCDFYTWIASGSQLAISRGRECWFEELQTIRPTYLNAVPYFYEKCWRTLRQRGMLNRKRALQKLLGGRIRIANCGGAAISDDVFDYFHAHDVCLVTGYGLTETSPVLSSSSAEKIRKGSVGPAVPGVELKIAGDGEILARGPNVMAGYFRDPTATKGAIRDGWFHTGDLGVIDDDGFLFIVGRKKEMIVTSSGINISPVAIESCLNRIPFVEQSMVVGDQQDFLVALLVVPSRHLEHALDKEPPREPDQAGDRPDVSMVVRSRIDQALRHLSKNEQVGAFLITEQPFSIDNGMLTSKSSLRRDEILKVFGSQLEQVYLRQRGSR